MMKKAALAFVFALTASLAAAQTAPKKVYNENIDQMAQIDSALAVAKQSPSGKFVVCQVGGNWCPWCLRFADFISRDSDIAKVVADNYVYIHVNYSRGGKTSPQQAKTAALMLKRLGRPERFGFPVLVVLGHDGNVLHIQDSSFLEKGEGYDKEKVLRFFNAWTPSAVNGVK